jgi:L-2-hydroxyglutarate oxidase LhgO
VTELKETSVCVEAVVVGGGIIGLAIARALLLTGKEVVVLEKSTTFAGETSARNSEVIHAGIYYPTDSLKAQLCVVGAAQLYQYLADNRINFKRLGKTIVATSDEQIPALQALYQQGLDNGVEGLVLSTETPIIGLPTGVTAQAAIHSANTGVFDSNAYALSLLADIERLGGLALCQAACQSSTYDGEGFELAISGAADYNIHCQQLINAAGLGAEQVATSMSGVPAAAIRRQRLCKGSYFQYTAPHRFEHLVYPMPSTDGLGVHATVDMAGLLRFGPDVEWLASVDYRVDSSRASSFARQVSRYWPDIELAKLTPAYSGIRPKVVGLNGQVLSDFCVLGPLDHNVAGLVMLYGIESPGLTASLALADYVANLLH